MDTSTMISFRAGPIAPALAARVAGRNPGDAARSDLQRYYDLLGVALASVTLEQSEAALIVDALNGTIIDQFAIQLLDASIEDSYHDGLAEKWNVDGTALLAKVRGWNLLQRAAVCDAVERFWANSYHVEDTSARLRAVGLVRQI